MRFILMALILAACSGGKFNSSAPKNANISDLSEDEICELGEELAEFSSDYFENDFCYFFGQTAGIAAEVTGGDYREACEAAYNDCQSEEDFAVNPGDLECNAEVLAGCDATVGEYEQCINDTFELIQSVTDKKCQPQTLAEFEEASREAEEGASSCEALAGTCPGAGF